MLDDLEPDRALAGDHGRIDEGVDVVGTGLVGVLAGDALKIQPNLVGLRLRRARQNLKKHLEAALHAAGGTA